MKQSSRKKRKLLENPTLESLLAMRDLVILYLRISREDNRDGESYSIENQRKLLLEFAEKNNFENIVCLTDDGVSGVTDKRKEFQKFLALVKADKVKTVIVKDMSRLGRNYLSVGEYVEYLFPSHDVRLIAVNDGVDTINGVDDFTSFRNLMNEWYARDASRKIKSTFKSKGLSGVPVMCVAPYGYAKSAQNPNKWIVDNEAAEVIKRIYKLTLEGNGPYQICNILKR